MSIDINKNAMTVLAVAIINHLNENSLIDKDGNKGPPIDLIFQADALVQVGLATKIKEGTYKIHEDRLSENIESILDQCHSRNKICYTCKFYSDSNFAGDVGWCTHEKSNDLHITISEAKKRICPGCPIK